MSLQYGLEKFKAALFDLVEPGDIHVRLRAAISQHLIHLSPSNDVAEIIKDQLQELLEQYHDNCIEKINALNEIDAENLAKHIVNMHCQWLESLH